MNKQNKNNGPLSALLWSKLGVSELLPGSVVPNAEVEAVVAASIASLFANKAAGTAYDGNGKITDKSMTDLGAAGWWGLYIPKQYGGHGASCTRFMSAISEMAAAGFMSEAGINGIHTDLGAPHKLIHFGSEEQKQALLPALASGERLSALAATEPTAGTHLAALQTSACRQGDHYVVNGEKLFIGNAVPSAAIGRTVAVLARVEAEGDDSYAVFMVNVEPGTPGYVVVPHGKNGEHGLHAIRQARNTGLRFENLRVPAANRIEGNGLKHVYHGLNFGRVAVCANAAGAMRLILRIISPNAWGKYRETFGKPIEERELIKTRVARLAALIVGADAIRDFASRQLEAGNRAELECIIAKIYGSEALKEAAIDLGLMTVGGRGFLQGHPIGDNLHDFLAACIYDGQNDMLRQKFVAELGREHFERFLKPLAEGMKSLKKGRFNGAATVVGKGLALAFWKLATRVKRYCNGQSVKGLDRALAPHLDFALAHLPKLAAELSGKMLKHGKALSERQNVLIRISQRIQENVIMLMTIMHAHASKDLATIAAADVLCRDLRRKLTGAQADEAYDRACVKLADLVLAGEFKQLAGTVQTPILRPYKKA